MYTTFSIRVGLVCTYDVDLVIRQSERKLDRFVEKVVIDPASSSSERYIPRNAGRASLPPLQVFAPHEHGLRITKAYICNVLAENSFENE